MGSLFTPTASESGVAAVSGSVTAGNLRELFVLFIVLLYLLLCREVFTTSIGQFRKEEVLPRDQRNRAMSNYVFADGHAKTMPWAATWQPIGPDQNINGTMLTPTMWRQNFNGWQDQCNYQAGQNR